MSRVHGRRLALLAPERSGDGAGGILTEWRERGALWASVRMRSGGSRATEFGRAPRLGLRITTHLLPQGHPMRPVPGHRLRDGGRLYAVEAVHESGGRGGGLAILATEVTSGEGAR